MKRPSAIILTAIIPLAAYTVQAGNLLIIGSDDTSDLNSVAAEFASAFTSVGTYDSASGTPSQGLLDSYSSVLAWTDATPVNGTLLGNELATFVNGGGRLTLATYDFSTPWEIGGTIMSHGYSPLVDLGVNGSVSGNIVPVAPGESVFNGISPSAYNTLTYFQNFNYAHPGLDSGATLLATDGAGVDMVAVNAAGNVYGVNIYPGYDYPGNGVATFSPAFIQLLDNTLNGGSISSVPDAGSSMLLLSLGLGGITALRRRFSKV